MKREIEKCPEGGEGDVIAIPTRKLIDVANATRFEVINHSKDGNGKEYVRHNVSISDVSLQDDGKTLKIFLK